MTVELDSADMTEERERLRFDDFVMENASSLLRFAYLLTGNSGAAEDLVQDALIKVHRRWGDHIRAERPNAYVRRIILNQHVGWLRLRRSTEIVGPVPDRMESDGTDMLALRDLLWDALGRLPRRQRAVLVLRYYEALNDADIAALLGCREGTVRSLAARAFAVLRRHGPLLEEVGSSEGARRENP